MIETDLAAALQDLAAAPELLVALDFDGTLSHLMPTPDQARPTAGVLAALAVLHDLPGTRLVLVSGRARADLARVSGAGDLAELIGSHGQERAGTDDALDPEQAKLLATVRAEVAPLVAGVDAAMLEDKPAGFAVHVRNSPPQAGAELLAQVVTVAGAHGIATLPGKAVVEVSVRPMSKGLALAEYREACGHPPTLFAGDDVTDESAMSVLGPDAVTIKVGAGASQARFRVADPDEMSAVLAELARLRTAALAD